MGIVVLHGGNKGMQLQSIGNNGEKSASSQYVAQVMASTHGQLASGCGFIKIRTSKKEVARA